MSNWGTAVQTVKERIHRYGTADPDTIKRALAEAIRKYSTVNFYFNQGTYDINLTAATYNYGEETTSGLADGYPADMLKPIKLSLQVSSTWHKIFPISIDLFRDLFVATSYQGYPFKWAWFGEELLFHPTPNAVYVVRMDYVKDIGTPVPTYASSAWSYTVGGDAVTDVYTNAWFTTGLDLITARAVYYLASQHFSNQELAMLAKGMEQEQYMDLIIDSEASEISPDPQPWG